MKSRIIILMYVIVSITNNTILNAQKSENIDSKDQEAAIKKMMMDFGYGYYKILHLDEPLESNGFEKNLTKEENEIALSKGAINEGVLSALKTLKFGYSSSNSSYFEIDKTFFDTPGLKNQVEITVYFDEILDNYGQNIVEVGTKETLIEKNLTRFTSDEKNMSFSANFTEELEDKKPYKATGNLVVKMKNLEGYIKLTKNDIGIEKKIGDLSFKIFRFDKGGVILEVPGNDDLIEYNYKKEGLTFVNRMSHGVYKDNPLFEIFKKYDHALSEKELEGISKDIDFKQLMEKQDESKGAYKCVILGDTPDEIIIKSYGLDTQEQFPFEIFNEGVRLRREPVLLETLDKEKLNIREIGGYEFAEDTDIQDITELELDGTSEYENPKTYKTLPTELIKFANLERLSFILDKDADLKQIEGVIEQLPYLKNIEIEGRRIEDEEGNYQFHGFKSFPAFLFENKNLEHIRLTDHLFTEIPENTLSKAPKLRVITLSDNVLTKIPNDIALLKSLELIDFSDNYIAQLPESICGLTELQYVRMSGNRLINLPKCLLAMESLQEVSIDGNGLNIFLNSLKPINDTIFYVGEQRDLEPLDEDYQYLEKLEELKN